MMVEHRYLHLFPFTIHFWFDNVYVLQQRTMNNFEITLRRKYYNISMHQIYPLVEHAARSALMVG
jgi:hypothetical protein